MIKLVILLQCLNEMENNFNACIEFFFVGYIANISSLFSKVTRLFVNVLRYIGKVWRLFSKVMHYIIAKGLRTCVCLCIYTHNT